MVESRTAGEPLRVIYIAGSGRAGSTLLARLLGEVDGFRNLGEAARGLFNERMLQRMRSCGCGEDLADCPFWGPIAGQVDARLRAFATAEVRLRAFGRLARGRQGADFQALAEEMRQLLERAAARSGGGVLVDASKHPTNALLLAGIPGLRLHVVHLVRDPRAVVASWTQAKGYLSAQPAAKVALWWRWYNRASERLRELAVGYRRLRYEELVADPEGALREVLADVAAADSALPFLEGDAATLGVQHTVAGNPDRSRFGTTRIRRRAWRLSPPRALLTELLTYPLLRRYGYPTRASSG